MLSIILLLGAIFLGVIVLLIISLFIASAISSYKDRPPPPLPDSQVIEMLKTLDLGAIPEALAGTPPRRDVFSFRGYLKWKPHRRRYLPMLIEGRVYRGLCICLHDVPGAGECDRTYEYAWLDDAGRLHRRRATQYFDHHAVLSQGSGEVHLSVDADFVLNHPLTIVCSNTTDEHIIYEALLIERDPMPPPDETVARAS